jgi:hypothetical protein
VNDRTTNSLECNCSHLDIRFTSSDLAEFPGKRGDALDAAREIPTKPCANAGT